MFAYCRNNPITYADWTGNLPAPVFLPVDFDAPATIDNYAQLRVNSPKPQTRGQYNDGTFQASWAITDGYGEIKGRLSDTIKTSGAHNSWLGGFAKVSLLNASGNVGVGNENASVSLKVVTDVLTSNAQAGFHYKDQFGFGVGAKASVFSGRGSVEFNLWGWKLELGGSLHALSVGAEATIIYSPKSGLDLAVNASALFGAGFQIRITPPQ